MYANESLTITLILPRLKISQMLFYVYVYTYPYMLIFINGVSYIYLFTYLLIYLDVWKSINEKKIVLITHVIFNMKS